ncbi:MAG: peptidylprolyl isomerase [Rubripirellula sp.]
MQIAEHSVVFIDYTLTGDDGDVIDSSSEGTPLCYLHGHGNIIPGLENALTGKAVGDQLKVTVEPEDGYGARRDELRQVVARERFGDTETLEVGMRFRVPTENGGQGVVAIVEINNDLITVDGNHDLAGKTLHFDVTVREIREATPEELEHGHAHGDGGHVHE